MLIKFVMAFFYFQAAYSAELICSKGEITSSKFEITTVQKTEYCVNADKTVITSKDCAKLNCAIFNKVKLLKSKPSFYSFGNPGFKICREIGGHPELIQFTSNAKTFKLDRCTLGNGSFVSSGLLIAKSLTEVDLLRKISPPSQKNKTAH